jgi:hypothetical protein
MRTTLFIALLLLSLAGQASAVCVGTNAFETAQCVDSPHDLFPLNETSGTVANDISGNARNGTYGTGITLNQTGPFTSNSASALLPGTSAGSVTVTTDTAAADFTSECMVKIAAQQTATAIYHSGGGGDYLFLGHWQGTSSTPIVGQEVIGLATAWVEFNKDPDLSLKQWHYVAESTASNVHTLYIDGFAYAQTNSSSPTAGSGTQGFGVSSFAGNLADCARYDVGLSASQVANHWAAAKAIYAIQSGTDAYSTAVLKDLPSFYWRLGETSGTAAADATGNGFTGTYAGGFTLGQPGPFDTNTGTQFNGSTGKVTNTSQMTVKKSDWTLEAYFKITGSTSGQITKIGNAGGYGLCVGNGTNCTTNGSTLMLIAEGNQYYTLYNGLALNHWYYAAVTAVAAAALIHKYLDRDIGPTQTIVGAFVVPDGPVQSVGSLNGSSRFFNGLVAEAAWYDYPLTDSQIAAHASAAATIGSGIWPMP